MGPQRGVSGGRGRHLHQTYIMVYSRHILRITPCVHPLTVWIVSVVGFGAPECVGGIKYKLNNLGQYRDHSLNCFDNQCPACNKIDFLNKLIYHHDYSCYIYTSKC